VEIMRLPPSNRRWVRGPPRVPALTDRHRRPDAAAAEQASGARVLRQPQVRSGIRHRRRRDRSGASSPPPSALRVASLRRAEPDAADSTCGCAVSSLIQPTHPCRMRSPSRRRNQLLAPAVQRHPAEAIAAAGEVFSREPLKRSRDGA
jgi:hypothetical protein